MYECQRHAVFELGDCLATLHKSFTRASQLALKLLYLEKKMKVKSMAKVRCKRTNADSLLATFFMTRKYKDHFLVKALLPRLFAAAWSGLKVKK